MVVVFAYLFWSSDYPVNLIFHVIRISPAFLNLLYIHMLFLLPSFLHVPILSPSPNPFFSMNAVRDFVDVILLQA